jgi:hypothetical protein
MTKASPMSAAPVRARPLAFVAHQQLRYSAGCPQHWV